MAGVTVPGREWTFPGPVGTGGGQKPVSRIVPLSPRRPPAGGGVEPGAPDQSMLSGPSVRSGVEPRDGEDRAAKSQSRRLRFDDPRTLGRHGDLVVGQSCR